MRYAFLGMILAMAPASASPPANVVYVVAFEYSNEAELAGQSVAKTTAIASPEAAIASLWDDLPEYPAEVEPYVVPVVANVTTKVQVGPYVWTNTDRYVPSGGPLNDPSGWQR